MKEGKAPLLWRLDMWLLLRVFAPIVWYVDKRWHVNHYKQAAQVFTFSAFLVVIHDGIVMMGEGAGMKFIMTMLAGIICLVRYDNIKDMAKLSAAYERQPDKIPYAAIPFILPYGRMMHLMGGIFFLFLSIVTFALPNPLFYKIVHFIAEQWFLTAGIAYYIAGLPPSPHKRVEKKARAWTFGSTPIPIQTNLF